MAFVLVGLNCELKMGLPSFLLSFFLVFHLLPCSGSPCTSFDCRRCPIKFPFTKDTYPLCGLCLLRCDEPVPEVVLGEEGTSYQVSGIYNDTIKISDPKLNERIESKDCDIFSDIIPPNTPFISSILSTSLTFFKCNTNSPAIDDQKDKHFFDNYTSYTGEDCKGHTVYYSYPNNTVPTHYPGNCEFFQLPVVSSAGRRNQSDPFSLLTSNFSVEYHFPSLSPPISPSSNVPKERGTDISVLIPSKTTSIYIKLLHMNWLSLGFQLRKF